ncbi:MAG: plasmid mobilization relaxosome protein MobC [Afipia sp.]|nr:plasmid mobilization relaxosome protein MobC [Afipia sp.]
MRRSQGSAPGTRNRRERVAHIRYSEQEFSAIGAAASAVGMSISAFVRSLSLEGAGVQPFLSPADRAILELLCQDMRIVGNNLNQVARTLNSGAVPRTADLTGAVNDAQAIATTVASELAAMTKASAASRRGVPS